MISHKKYQVNAIFTISECDPEWKKFDSTCLQIVGAPRKSFDEALEQCHTIGGKIWESEYSKIAGIGNDQIKELENMNTAKNCYSKKVWMKITDHPEGEGSGCNHFVRVNNGKSKPSECASRCMFCQL